MQQMNRQLKINLLQEILIIYKQFKILHSKLKKSKKN